MPQCFNTASNKKDEGVGGCFEPRRRSEGISGDPACVLRLQPGPKADVELQVLGTLGRRPSASGILPGQKVKRSIKTVLGQFTEPHRGEAGSVTRHSPVALAGD